MIQEHHDGAADHSLRLWVLLQLEMWHREVTESPPVAESALSGYEQQPFAEQVILADLVVRV